MLKALDKGRKYIIPVGSTDEREEVLGRAWDWMRKQQEVNTREDFRADFHGKKRDKSQFIKLFAQSYDTSTKYVEVTFHPNRVVTYMIDNPSSHHELLTKAEFMGHTSSGVNLQNLYKEFYKRQAWWEMEMGDTFHTSDISDINYKNTADGLQITICTKNSVYVFRSFT